MVSDESDNIAISKVELVIGVVVVVVVLVGVLLLLLVVVNKVVVIIDKKFILNLEWCLLWRPIMLPSGMILLVGNACNMCVPF